MRGYHRVDYARVPGSKKKRRAADVPVQIEELVGMESVDGRVVRDAELEEVHERAPLLIGHSCVIAASAENSAADGSNFYVGDGLVSDKPDNRDVAVWEVAGAFGECVERCPSSRGVMIRSGHRERPK